MTYQLTETELQELLRKQREICAAEYYINGEPDKYYEDLYHTILNAPLPPITITKPEPLNAEGAAKWWASLTVKQANDIYYKHFPERRRLLVAEPTEREKEILFSKIVGDGFYSIKTAINDRYRYTISRLSEPPQAGGCYLAIDIQYVEYDIDKGWRVPDGYDYWLEKI